MKNILKNVLRRETLSIIKASFKNEGKRLCKEEHGYYLTFYAITFVVFFIMLASIINIGVVIGEKMRIQYAADEAGYSEAVVAARMYNFLAYTNRAILANYSTICFVTALKSQSDAYKALESIPFVGMIFKPAEQTYTQLYQATNFLRQAASILSHALTFYQAAVLTEGVINICSSKVGKEIAKEIDPKIKINEISKRDLVSSNAVSFMRVFGFLPPIHGGAQGVFSKVSAAVTKVAGGGKMGKFIGGLFEEMADNSTFRELLYQSTDGFARGTSLPRSFKFSLGAIKFTFGGDLAVNENEIDQSDLGFTVYAFGFKILRLGLIHEISSDVDLGKWGFYNYTDVPEFTQESGATFYTVASKDKNDIFQLSPFGFKMGLNKDIAAISKSQTFYFDPDQERSDSLAKGMQGPNMSAFDVIQASVFGGPREPNLFNPFWHASLKDCNLIQAQGSAGVTQDFFQKLDGNFGLSDKIRNSIQYKIYKSILKEMVNGEPDSSLIVH